MNNTYFHTQKQIKSVNDLYEIFSLDKNLYSCEYELGHIQSKKEYFSMIFNFSRLQKKEEYISEFVYEWFKEFEGKNDVCKKYSQKLENIIRLQLMEKHKHILENRFLYTNGQVPSYAKLNKNNRL